MMRFPQKTICSIPGGCSDLGGPCPSCICENCGGRGYVPGDPEADPIEECQDCDGTGHYVVPISV
jgi:hypothetical protein